MDLFEYYKNCRLCPRDCGVNRTNGKESNHLGLCGETHELRVAYVGPHFGEEPPISGKNGSGTVFFSGCSLKCSFCQNYQITHQGLGVSTGLGQLMQKLKKMIHVHQVHNINFVTPDHFFPHVFRLVSVLRDSGLDLPIVYNLSGYQSVALLKIAGDYNDIYLPDYKYSEPSLAAGLSRCPDYPQKAIEAIYEMVRQKGFLDTCSKDNEIARRGVLVRHLILPGKVKNSIDALTSLFVEFGSGLPVSLMSQYHPVLRQKDRDLNRFISSDEFERVYSHAMDLGFENLFIQFPDKGAGCRVGNFPFLPDFRRTEPFSPLE